MTILVISIAISTFFVGYFYADYQKVGYQEGLVTGYNKGIQDIFTYNTQPANWIVLDKKYGLAELNGTTVNFTWNENNVTRMISLKSPKPFQHSNTMATLFLMSDAVKLPQQIENATNLYPKLHYIMVDSQNSKYQLELPSDNMQDNVKR